MQVPSRLPGRATSEALRQMGFGEPRERAGALDRQLSPPFARTAPGVSAIREWKAMDLAFSNAYFDSLGLPSLDFRDWPCREPLTGRTAVYGPVCTVVWEGRIRETPPDPCRQASCGSA